MSTTTEEHGPYTSSHKLEDQGAPTIIKGGNPSLTIYSCISCAACDERYSIVKVEFASAAGRGRKALFSR